ncbi:hypothetical protein SISSUDRAFT_827163 [Sistotremastrum suecicum HHB10207 ss-3]|uniref:Uncharacterized protein n=1 Tax=Sistotremastrum suecicum HHB10207 ss-3 TaxID=1314776 RepID=A0A166CPW5_9AGAM|nr:hypothetical protein SISSUDRAFT_827163 [Sistotremastrum suecicum HHB10207 ss-3]
MSFGNFGGANIEGIEKAATDAYSDYQKGGSGNLLQEGQQLVSDYTSSGNNNNQSGGNSGSGVFGALGGLLGGGGSNSNQNQGQNQNQNQGQGPER